MTACQHEEHIIAVLSLLGGIGIGNAIGLVLGCRYGRGAR
jgi:hypothetical protein